MIFPTSFPWALQGDGKWGLRSLHHTSSLPLLPPHALSLLQRGVPPMGGSPPGSSPTWVLPMGCIPSWTAPAWVLPQGAVLQEQAAAAWVTHGITSPVSKPALAWARSAGPGRSLLQRRAPHRVTTFFRYPPALAWGPFHGLQVDICSTVDLHGLQGDSLPHQGLYHKLKGKTLCSGIPPSSLTLVSAELFLSHRLAPLSQLPFLPLLKSVIPEELPPSLMGLALGSGRAVLELAGTGLYQTWGKLLAASDRSHPYSPPATKTLPRKPITRFHKNIRMAFGMFL